MLTHQLGVVVIVAAVVAIAITMFFYAYIPQNFQYKVTLLFKYTFVDLPSITKKKL